MVGETMDGVTSRSDIAYERTNAAAVPELIHARVSEFGKSSLNMMTLFGDVPGRGEVARAMVITRSRSGDIDVATCRERAILRVVGRRSSA